MSTSKEYKSVSRASRGTWTSPLVARTTVTSTTVAGFGR